MAIFGNVQHCIYADIVIGGLEEAQNYTDAIYGWSPTELESMLFQLIP